MFKDISSGVLEREVTRGIGSNEIPQRVLGKTGESVPVLGLGSAPGADAIALYHKAIDRGVTYIDTATGYGRAQAQLGEVMGERREEVFLVTKTHTEDGAKALEILEQNMRLLQTDQVDLTYVHAVGGLDVDRVLGKDGSLAGLREAQRRGWTRFVGFTAHQSPWKSAKVLREAEVDVVMLALNPGDRFTYNFEENALPLASLQNAGVAAMKVYGGAEGMKYSPPKPSAVRTHGSHNHEVLFRYALSLPGVAIAVIGMYTEEELNQNIRWAKGFTPLTEREEKDVLTLGKELSGVWGPHFGPVE